MCVERRKRERERDKKKETSKHFFYKVTFFLSHTNCNNYYIEIIFEKFSTSNMENNRLLNVSYFAVLGNLKKFS